MLRQRDHSFLKLDDDTKIGVKPVICVEDQFKNEINPKWKRKFHISSEQIQSFRSSRASNLTLNADNIDPNAFFPSVTESRQSLTTSPSMHHTAGVGADVL